MCTLSSPYYKSLVITITDVYNKESDIICIRDILLLGRLPGDILIKKENFTLY
ncbi:MAG: DUF2905 family protein, partial [Thermodesulfovibrionales bacterium]